MAKPELLDGLAWLLDTDDMDLTTVPYSQLCEYMQAMMNEDIVFQPVGIRILRSLLRSGVSDVITLRVSMRLAHMY
jgi:hypothetical protein